MILIYRYHKKTINIDLHYIYLCLSEQAIGYFILFDEKGLYKRFIPVHVLDQIQSNANWIMFKDNLDTF